MLMHYFEFPEALTEKELMIYTIHVVEYTCSHIIYFRAYSILLKTGVFGRSTERLTDIYIDGWMDGQEWIYIVWFLPDEVKALNYFPSKAFVSQTSFV